jgi:NADP-dependent aldehyde dehydrogenase
LPLADNYPISQWSDCEAILESAAKASVELRTIDVETIALFLGDYADRIEANAESLAKTAASETGLPIAPRLIDVELPRTTNQLRQAAAAAREGSWSMPTIDTKNNIRSYLAPIGPVVTIGPNNFPFAYNGAAGGDFAAAIATGNPVIIKAHPSHPTTTRMLTELAQDAATKSRLPRGTLQMLYRLSHADGARLVADRRVGATGFTGGRHSGMVLKAAADAVGKPIYLEMSSINPVVILPGAMHERSVAICDEFSTSCLMAAGQFCTNPGLVLLLAGRETDEFVTSVANRFSKSPAGTLLSVAVCKSLGNSVEALRQAGAKLLVGGQAEPGPRIAFQNTLLTVSGNEFLDQSDIFQTEMFGAASLFVVAETSQQLVDIISHLEGNLTGSVYTSNANTDDAIFDQVASVLRWKVGRFLNNKMPTGVAVSPAMNHGGPFPSTGHPGFTAVGIPAALRRFGTLQCFDGVGNDRLPIPLRNMNPNGKMWRWIDGGWTQRDVGDSTDD